MLASSTSDINDQLRLAARDGSAQRCAALLDLGADANDTKHPKRFTALHCACIAPADVTEVLLRGGANVAITDTSGWTALHWAAARGRADLCKLLVDAATYNLAKGSIPDTPLILAVKSDADCVATVRYFLDECGEDVYQRYGPDGKTLDEVAAQTNALDVMRFLIDYRRALETEQAVALGIDGEAKAGSTNRSGPSPL